ncbi:response regulator [candidate division KSB1 bacterium]|nr:response regulator [candidate division KSB1 bacterium]
MSDPHAAATALGRLRRVTMIDSDKERCSSLIRVLRENGILCQVFPDGKTVLERIVSEKSNLIIIDHDPPSQNAPTILQQIRNNSNTRHLPVIITGHEPRLEDRLRILKMDIDDFVDRPYYPEEMAVRIEALLQENDVLQDSLRLLQHGFDGSLKEMSLADLLQTLELGCKSGRIDLRRGSQRGTVFIKEGKLIDAELGDLDPEKAFYYLMAWLDGFFQVILGPSERAAVLLARHSDLVSRGLRYYNRCRELSGQLPPLTSVMQADPAAPVSDLSAAETEFFQLFVQPRSVESVFVDSGLSDWVAMERLLQLIDKKKIRLVQEGRSKAENPGRQWMNKLHRQTALTKNRYARVVSFFFRRSSETHEANDRAEAQSLGHHNQLYRIFLNRGELLLLRQKLVQSFSFFIG